MKSAMSLKRLGGLFRSYWMIMGLFLVVMAVFLTFFLQYRYFIDDWGRAWEFFTQRSVVFWYNAFLMFLILVFLTGLTRRPAISVGILLAVVIFIAYLHVRKFEARGYPLLPEDLLLASETESMLKMINVGKLC